MLSRNNPFYKYLTYEDKEHVRLVEYINKTYPHIVYFHIPNEGKKTAFERYKHSIMGALEGAPDFMFLVPKVVEGHVIHHGLLIELKAPEHKRVVLKGKNAGKIVKAVGKLSESQKIVLEKVNNAKYLGICCFGYDEAVLELKKYMEFGK
jgi:hypothetical protein